MKANVVRLMAGGLAAVMLMSNMTVTTVLADELDAPVSVETTSEESSSEAPAQESAPAPSAEETPAPAVEAAPAPVEVPAVEMIDPAPAPVVEESVPAPAPVVEESVPAPAPVVEESVPAPAPVVEESVPAPAPVAEETPAPEEEPVLGTAPSTEEVGTSQAGNEDELGGHAGSGYVEEEVKDAQAERIVKEYMDRNGVAHAGDIGDVDVPEADPAQDLTITKSEEKKTVELRQFGAWGLMRPTVINNKTDHYSNGDVVKTVQVLDSDNKVVSEEYYLISNGVQVKMESNDPAVIRSYSQAARIKSENAEAIMKADKQAAADAEAKAKAKAELEAKVSGMTMEELRDFWDGITSVDRKLADAKFAVENGSEMPQIEITQNEDELLETLSELGMDVIKSVVENGIDKAVDKIPGADFFGDPIKDLFKKSFGLKEDEKKEDANKTIRDETDRVIAELNRMQKDMKDDNINAEAFQSYNETLNSFDNFVNSRVNEINLTNTVKGYSDIQKLVRSAFTIGGEDDWLTGENPIFDLLRNAGKILQGGQTSDKEDRSYFDLMYDYQKDNSLFAGEAMQKAEKYIQARVQRFAQSCSRVVDILKMQMKVCDLSEDQVAKMDKKTRTMYEKIAGCREMIQARIQYVTDIFTNAIDYDNSDDTVINRTKSIFQTAKDYYAKDKTVYIDKGHNGDGVNLKDNIVSYKGTKYNQEVIDYGGSEATDVDGARARNRVIADMNKGKLSRDDVIKIAKQAREMNMTIKDYLAYCGFNVTAMKDGGYLVTRDFHTRTRKEEYDGASGYSVSISKPIEENVTLVDEIGYDAAQNRNSNFFYFEAE